MVLKTDRFGQYWSCTGYPACHHSESQRDDEPQEKISCPVCGQATLSMKRTPTGKEMYICPSDQCDFMSWGRPHPRKCPVCRSPFLVEKRDRQGNTMLCCPRAGCRHREILAAADPSSPPKKSKKRLVRRKKGGKKLVRVRRKKN